MEIFSPPTNEKENAMKTHKILTAILVLQVLTILNQWFGGPISKARRRSPMRGAAAANH